MKKKYMILAYAMTAVFGLYGCSNNPSAATTAAVVTSADDAGEKSADETEAAEKTTESADETETEAKNETAESGADQGATAETDTAETTAEATEKESDAETDAETEAEETTVSEETSAPAASVQETAPAASSTPVVHTGYCFQTGGTVIGMNQDVSTFLGSLGSYTNYAESKSCAFKGLDKIYSYAGFDLYTYPVDGVDYVNSIYLSDGTVSTQEGIHIGSTLDDMLAAYGDGYTEEYGVYQYAKDKSTLSFIVTDNVIEAIEYTAITK